MTTGRILCAYTGVVLRDESVCARCDELRNERDQAVDRAEKMHLLGLKLAREIADLERENASLRRRLREGGR